jgi:hypothetical protein
MNEQKRDDAALEVLRYAEQLVGQDHFRDRIPNDALLIRYVPYGRAVTL